MEDTCNKAPTDKKAYITAVGKILVKEHGKKRHYEPKEVEKAHKKSSYADLDFASWAMSIYSSYADFDTYHEQLGETGDYIAMRKEMLNGLALSANVDLSNLATIPDMDASWLDLGDVFDGIFEGIGSVFSALFEIISESS